MVSQTVTNVQQAVIFFEIDGRLCHKITCGPVSFLLMRMEQAQDILLGKHSDEGHIIFDDWNAGDTIAYHDMYGFEYGSVFTYANDLFCHNVFYLRHYHPFHSTIKNWFGLVFSAIGFSEPYYESLSAMSEKSLRCFFEDNTLVRGGCIEKSRTCRSQNYFVLNPQRDMLEIISII